MYAISRDALPIFKELTFLLRNRSPEILIVDFYNNNISVSKNDRPRIRRSHLVNEKGIFVHFVFNRTIVFSKLHIFFFKKKVNVVLLSSYIFINQ